MEDDTTHQETVMLPKGDPGNPMTPEEIATKFRANCAGVLSEERTAALLAAIRSLPELPSVERLLAPG
jgi:2-methylcitrate dehydratase PrpD